MPRARQSKYFWPASAITEADMALLHAVSKRDRVPITQLIAIAIRETYGQLPVLTLPNETQQDNRKAA